MFESASLPADVVLRLVDVGDAAAVAAAYDRNREHLAPWDPVRPSVFYTDEWHRASIRERLEGYGSGSNVPLVLSRGEVVVGLVNLSGIVRGAFQSANLGYWVDAGLTGQGVMSAAVTAVVEYARAPIDDGGAGLHRLQAGTLPHNAASQAVLLRNGFEEFGYARDYLEIAGRWQDHRLFQRILSVA